MFPFFQARFRPDFTFASMAQLASDPTLSDDDLMSEMYNALVGGR